MEALSFSSGARHRHGPLKRDQRGVVELIDPCVCRARKFVSYGRMRLRCTHAYTPRRRNGAGQHNEFTALMEPAHYLRPLTRLRRRLMLVNCSSCIIVKTHPTSITDERNAVFDSSTEGPGANIVRVTCHFFSVNIVRIPLECSRLPLPLGATSVGAS